MQSGPGGGGGDGRRKPVLARTARPVTTTAVPVAPSPARCVDADASVAVACFLCLALAVQGLQSSTLVVQSAVVAVASLDNAAWVRFMASACAAAFAEFVSLPIDVAKVRLQLRGRESHGRTATSASGVCLLACLRQLWAEGGPAALWSGLEPAVLRQVCYTSLCMVLYEPVRGYIAEHMGLDVGTVGILQGFVAGAASGAIAVAISNPVDVVKTQMQKKQHNSEGLTDVVQRIWAADGLGGFWSGMAPNVARSSLSSAAELGSYDQAALTAATFLGPGMPSYLAASTAAALCSALACTPADVVKTRLMGAAGGSRADDGTGVVGTVSEMIATEGIWSLYAGFVPICLRKLVWCATFFASYEALRTTLIAP